MGIKLLSAVLTPLLKWNRTLRSVGGRLPSQLCRLLDVFDRVSTSVKRVSSCLDLDNNPWAEPPEPVVHKGPKGIREYFEDLYAEPCRIERNSLKIIVVGQEGAGKTR